MFFASVLLVRGFTTNFDGDLLSVWDFKRVVDIFFYSGFGLDLSVNLDCDKFVVVPGLLIVCFDGVLLSVGFKGGLLSVGFEGGLLSVGFDGGLLSVGFDGGFFVLEN